MCGRRGRRRRCRRRIDCAVWTYGGTVAEDGVGTPVLIHAKMLGRPKKIRIKLGFEPYGTEARGIPSGFKLAYDCMNISETHTKPMQSMIVYACKTKYFFNYLIISYLSSNVSFSQPLGVLSFFLVMFSISS